VVFDGQQRSELGDAEHGFFELPGGDAQEDRVAQTGVDAVERASADGAQAVMEPAQIRARRLQQNVGHAGAGGIHGRGGESIQIAS
jgi:hypothetical protein